MMEALKTEDSPNDAATKSKRKLGRFCVLDREIWGSLWNIPTRNRLNLITTFIVLLAGTGGDNRTTKWSARACEERVGIGKPRAKLAINELAEAGVLEHTDNSTPSYPQYRLPRPDREKDPIFLPVELVTGLSNETSALRRVRETGDPLVLRMLIDLYGMVEVDAPFSIPLKNLKQLDGEPNSSRKALEMGAHAVWALNFGNTLSASGDWTAVHRKNQKTGASWDDFWARVRLLERIGLLYFEPWVFSGEDDDAEPLFPINLDAMYAGDTDSVAELTRSAFDAASALADERPYLLDNHPGKMFVPLPLHHSAPALRGVAKLRVEADTPGRRRAYALRMTHIEDYFAAFRQLERDAHAGDYSRPLRLHQTK